jgi:hypothetical protein
VLLQRVLLQRVLLQRVLLQRVLLQRVLLQRVPPRVHAQPQVAHSLSTKAGADSSGVAGEDAHHSHRAHIPGESQHRLRLAQKNVDLLPGLEETLVALDGHPDEVIVDEMWTFIGQKDNTAWVWIALSRRNLQIIGFHIGRRSLDDARQLWQQLPGSCGNRCPAVVATGARQLWQQVPGSCGNRCPRPGRGVWCSPMRIPFTNVCFKSARFNSAREHENSAREHENSAREHENSAREHEEKRKPAKSKASTTP